MSAAVVAAAEGEATAEATVAAAVAPATVAAAVAPARMGVRRGRWHLRGDVAVQVGCGMAHHEGLQRAALVGILARPKLVAHLEARARGQRGERGWGGDG